MYALSANRATPGIIVITHIYHNPLAPSKIKRPLENSGATAPQGYLGIFLIHRMP